MPDLSHDAWVFLGIAIVQTAAIAVAWIEARKARQYAKPTGNGFAQRVEEKLDDIDKTNCRIEAKVDNHLRDHTQGQILNRS